MSQVYLNKTKGKLYVLFVDFLNAFPSIRHDLLWRKLLVCGLSLKFIKICKSIYDNATIAVRSSQGVTDAVEVTEGVLQGETLSPLLFSLFLSDFESYFRERGVEGVSVDHRSDIFCKAYADDLAIFAINPSDLKKKIKHLEQYCKNNGLSVNKQKTKIMIFHKGRLQEKYNTFYYEKEQIEIVKTFCYLGVDFSASGLFHAQLEKAKKSVKIALNSIMSLLHGTRVSDWNVKEKLIDSLVTSGLLYGIEIWGIRYSSEIDSIQTSIYKRLLNLQAYCPNYAVRREVGVPPLSCAVIKRIIGWVEKLNGMNNDRFPKICFDCLVNMSVKNSLVDRYNWFSRLTGIIRSVDSSISLSIHVIVNQKKEVIEKYTRRCGLEDERRVRYSSSLEVYPSLALEPGRQIYLNFKLPFDKIRAIAQCRLASNIVDKIAMGNKKLKYNPNENCDLCYQPKLASLYHTLVECTCFKDLRKDLFLNNMTALDVLNVKNKESANKLYLFVLELMERTKLL